MNKFFIILLPVFLFATSIYFPFELSLKKDEFAFFKVYFKNFTHNFKFRWTLYKNQNLIVIYHYDNFPRQILLYKDYPLNSFKVKISDLTLFFPYFWIVFKKFNGKIATFKIYLLNGKDVRVEKVKNGVF